MNMLPSKRHSRHVILKGIRDHAAYGDIPRAEAIISNPKPSEYKLESSLIKGIYRDGEGYDMCIIVEVEEGFIEVRTRIGVKWRNQIKESFDTWTHCPKDNGWSNFKDDLTIKETEFHLYALQDAGIELKYWYEEEYNRIVVPTNLNNRPTKEYLNGNSLNYDIMKKPTKQQLEGVNRNYLLNKGTSAETIDRLKEGGYLTDELIQGLDDSEAYADSIIAREERLRKSIEDTMKDSKEPSERVMKEYLTEQYNEMTTFKVIPVFQKPTNWERFLMLFGIGSKPRLKYRMLHMYDCNGNRILHTLNFITKKY